MLDRMTGSGGPDGPDRSSDERARMVERQLRQRGIADERVLAAMSAVPREAFVAPGQERLAYADEALPIAAGQTISQPYIVARMTELLGVGPGDRVLEIGTGSGYQAAVLARDRLPGHDDRADRRSSRRWPGIASLSWATRTCVDVRVGDGSVGAPEGAPWRGILVAAAAPAVPAALREQLDPAGGRLVLPVGPRDRQDLLVIVRNGNEWTRTERRPGGVRAARRRRRLASVTAEAPGSLGILGRP